MLRAGALAEPAQAAVHQLYISTCPGSLFCIYDVELHHALDLECCTGTGRLNGQSEKLLGKFIDEMPGGSQKQDAIAVATKIAPYPWRITPGQFANACR